MHTGIDTKAEGRGRSLLEGELRTGSLIVNVIGEGASGANITTEALRGLKWELEESLRRRFPGAHVSIVAEGPLED